MTDPANRHAAHRIARLMLERDALAQAIHDARGILGFDNDGDDRPHVSDYKQYAEFHVREAREIRHDIDVLDEVHDALGDAFGHELVEALTQATETLANMDRP